MIKNISKIILVSLTSSGLILSAESTHQQINPSNPTPISSLAIQKLNNWDTAKGSLISYAAANNGDLYVAAKTTDGSNTDIVVYKNNTEIFSAKKYNTKVVLADRQIYIDDTTTTLGSNDAVVLKFIHDKLFMIDVTNGTSKKNIAIQEIISSPTLDDASELTVLSSVNSSYYPFQMQLGYISNYYVISYFTSTGDFKVFKANKTQTTWNLTLLAAKSGTGTIPANSSFYSSYDSFIGNDFVFSLVSSSSTYTTFNLRLDGTNEYTLQQLNDGGNTNFAIKSNISICNHDGKDEYNIVVQNTTSSPEVYGLLYRITAAGAFEKDINGEIKTNFDGLSKVSNVSLDNLGDIYYVNPTTKYIMQVAYNKDHGYTVDHLKSIQKGMPKDVNSLLLPTFNYVNNNLDFAINHNESGIDKTEVYEIHAPSASSASTGVIIGAVIGSLAGVGIIAALTYYFVFYKKELPVKKTKSTKK